MDDDEEPWFDAGTMSVSGDPTTILLRDSSGLCTGPPEIVAPEADVVLLCFSLLSRTTLIHAVRTWLPAVPPRTHEVCLAAAQHHDGIAAAAAQGGKPGAHGVDKRGAAEQRKAKQHHVRLRGDNLGRSSAQARRVSEQDRGGLAADRHRAGVEPRLLVVVQ